MEQRRIPPEGKSGGRGVDGGGDLGGCGLGYARDEDVSRWVVQVLPSGGARGLEGVGDEVSGWDNFVAVAVGAAAAVVVLAVIEPGLVR